MLNHNNFTLEHIRKLQSETKRDPALLERVVYAFGLLEALSRVGLDFIFKGGTSLMLLLDKPMRLSTDIDIIVNPGTEVEQYIKKAAEIFPFISYDEDIRRTSRDIEKRHFKFYYASHLTGRQFFILLDVVYQNDGYSHTALSNITNIFLNCELPLVQVTTPTVNCILADKLTAFAPYTIGIPYGVDKELEIIKQHYDIAVLIDNMTDFSIVKNTYMSISENEIKYRDLRDTNSFNTLQDSFKAAITIIGRGNLFTGDYKNLASGMRKIKGHILSNYSPQIAEQQSCRIAYLIANLLSEKNGYSLITDATFYEDKIISIPEYTKLNYMKRQDILSFAYLYEAINLLTV